MTLPQVSHSLSASSLFLTMIGVLAGAATGWEPLSWLAVGGLLVYLADAAFHISFKGRLFLGLSAALAAVTVAVVPDARDVIYRALLRAAFICTLFASLGVLREAAETSPAVRRCGTFLAGQVPGRRYVALTLGGHLFAIILNYGVLPLLGAMAVNATAGDDTWRGKLRRRRMLTAIHRGMAAVFSWSPVTVAMVVVLSGLPGLTWGEVLPWCGSFAVGLLVVGWALDRAIRPPQPGGPFPKPPGTWAVTLPIIGLVALVFLAGMGWQALTGVELVVGVLTVVPFIAAGWLYVQARSEAGPGTAALRTVRRMGSHGLRMLPSYRFELALLSSAAFIGGLIAALLPHETMAALIDAAPLPSWALLWALAAFVVLVGQFGMNPILTVTIISGALPAPEVLGLPAYAVALAMTAAWSLTGATSPYTAGVLATAKLGGVTPETVGRRWNGPFALSGLLLLGAWLAAAVAWPL